MIACSSSERGEISEVYPKDQSIDRTIPVRPRRFLEQAADSLHAPSGSIMLCASSVDAILREKGYANGSLYSRIEQAAEDHVITPEMAGWAHLVRLEANERRHPDEITDLPDEAAARMCVDFTTALAEFLFVLPHRVNKGVEEAQKEAGAN